MGEDVSDEQVDPRRAMWRRGSYEIAGDWVRPASVSILDLLEEVSGASLGGRRILDLATGTGAVAIAAARRGAAVVGVDLTDELVEVAVRRAAEAGVEVRFELGDFDRLDEVIADEVFDVVTSSFGVMFAPDPAATLAHLAGRVPVGGLLGVTAWDPDGVLMVQEPLLELFPERPEMPDMSIWSTRIADLCAGTAFELAVARSDDLVVPFASVDDAAEQFERWSGGFAQLLETFDSFGVGDEARRRFREQLAAYSTATDGGIGLGLRYHASVLRRAS